MLRRGVSLAAHPKTVVHHWGVGNRRMNARLIRRMRVSRTDMRKRHIKAMLKMCASLAAMAAVFYLLDFLGVALVSIGMAVGAWSTFSTFSRWAFNLREAMEKYFDWDSFERDFAPGAQPTDGSGRGDAE